MFAKIERLANCTLMLADDFVHLAKAESKIYHYAEVDFLDIVADALDEIWAQASKKSIKIELQAQVECCWVKVNRSLIVRVLSNLLSNAIKYGPADSIVTCKVYKSVSTTPLTLICEISDQGDGIAVEDSRSLFTPFYQATQPSPKGAGLGLSFVKTVIDQHGGTINFSSAARGGAVFTMSLPRLES